MIRRAFLKLVSGVAAAGPVAVKSVASGATSTAAGLSAMDLPNTLHVPFTRSLHSVDSLVGSESTKEFARTTLERLMKPAVLDRKWKETRPVRIDPDLAACVSISTSAKLAIQRRRDFNFRIEEDRDYYSGIIAGLWQ